MATQRICDAMLPALSNIFQTSVAQASQVIWVFAVVYGLAQLFYGPLGDRTGKFRIITYATLGCSVGSLVAAFADNLNPGAGAGLDRLVRCCGDSAGARLGG
jgi:MFS family permease